MKKKIDTDALASELRNHSAFFRRPTPQPEPAQEQPQAAPPVPPTQPEQAQSPQPATVHPYGRTPVRRLTRVPFELFQDQLDRLRKISLDAKVRGEKGSMSEMVRQAIDRYLAENYPDEEK